MKSISFLLLFLSAISFAQNKGLKPIYSNEKCQEPIGYITRVNQRIITSDIEKDSLYIEIQYIENCANGKIIDYSIIKDTILFNFNFDFIDRDIADCDCVFINKLKIKNPKIKKPVFKINNTKGVRELKHSRSYFLPAEYKVKDNDTLVLFDDNGYHYTRTYFDSGKLKLLWIRKDSYSERIYYYENGMIKSISQIIGDINCYILKEWDINGKLINFIKSSDMDILFPKKSE
ncbi:hypothetical protein [Flavobacterium sp. N2270]|uniref:hypothetical protein n=1 Tax=Flavobacterium sp. N2270 TaxID=2986831 RepID=UPI002223F6B0|nr:hypothetical protein [Flavobacterium sp. N2270]